jgi:hypothetical protein
VSKSMELRVTPKTKECQVFLDEEEITQRVHSILVHAEANERKAHVFINGYEVDNDGHRFRDPENPSQAKTFVIKGRLVLDEEETK